MLVTHKRIHKNDKFYLFFPGVKQRDVDGVDITKWGYRQEITLNYKDKLKLLTEL